MNTYLLSLSRLRHLVAAVIEMSLQRIRTAELLLAVTTPMDGRLGEMLRLMMALSVMRSGESLATFLAREPLRRWGYWGRATAWV